MDYNKENKCSFCEGNSGWWLTHPNDPSGGLHFHPCYCGDGTRVGQLISDTEVWKGRYEQLHKDYTSVQEWMKKTSTCKTCNGDQHKTTGGIPCSECGLPGLQPWGG